MTTADLIGTVIGLLLAALIARPLWRFMDRMDAWTWSQIERRLTRPAPSRPQTTGKEN